MILMDYNNHDSSISWEDCQVSRLGDKGHLDRIDINDREVVDEADVDYSKEEEVLSVPDPTDGEPANPILQAAKEILSWQSHHHQLIPGYILWD